MPNWPKSARSYPTRILGDVRSAMILFMSTPELFGAEIRSVSPVDFGHGRRVERWVDYWDGRHFGTSGVAGLRVPADQFPPDFRESTVGEQAAARRVRRLQGGRHRS
jgi:hypothetical protein